nr:putative ribonuclease H-like domain-containing protein [Tanacetum cinerariifolium]
MVNQFNHKVKAIRCDNGTKFKNANLIEFCGSKGIRWDYSNARTPQQNGVAERKNQTLIEVTRTMLADSFLPTIFWTEVVATSCYVLNRVLVTKPHDKTPYELLTGDKPFISYLKPFGCHVTILNISDPLGKFDKKSDEGYIVGYSISSKAYRVYNLVSRKIEETMNLKFLENKPFVVGTGQAWMFPRCNTSNAGSLEDDSDSDDEPDVLIIQSTPTPVVPIVDEATTQNDGTKSDLAKTNADNLDELAELQALQRKEQAGTKEADHLGLTFPSLNLILDVGSASIGSFNSAGSTPPVSAGSTSLIPTGSAGRPVSAGRPYGSADRTPVPAGRILGKFTTSASSERFPRAYNVEILDIHDGLKIFDCPKSGIFTSSSYDEEFSGPDANNLESSLDVSSTITRGSIIFILLLKYLVISTLLYKLDV